MRLGSGRGGRAWAWRRVRVSVPSRAKGRSQTRVPSGRTRGSSRGLPRSRAEPGLYWAPSGGRKPGGGLPPAPPPGRGGAPPRPVRGRGGAGRPPWPSRGRRPGSLPRRPRAGYPPPPRPRPGREGVDPFLPGLEAHPFPPGLHGQTPAGDVPELHLHPVVGGVPHPQVENPLPSLQHPGRVGLLDQLQEAALQGDMALRVSVGDRRVATQVPSASVPGAPWPGRCGGPPPRVSGSPQSGPG